MRHQHRLSDTGSLPRSIATFCVLLAVIASGNTLLAQSPSYAFANRTEGTGFERVNDMARDASGNLYITGLFRGTVDFDPGSGSASLTSADSGIFEGDIFVA